jgi:hypothetical protein
LLLLGLVDELSRAIDEAFETRDERITGKPPARDREVSRGRAITRAEEPYTVRPELRGAAARTRDQLFELAPACRSLRDELV